MKITAKETTPEQALAFARDLSSALRRPVLRGDENEGVDPGDIVLEIATTASSDDIEEVQRIITRVADLHEITIWFWTYTTMRELVIN